MELTFTEHLCPIILELEFITDDMFEELEAKRKLKYFRIEFVGNFSLWLKKYKANPILVFLVK